MAFLLSIVGGRVLVRKRLQLQAAITTAQALADALAQETTPAAALALLARRHQLAVARIVPDVVTADSDPDLDRVAVLAHLQIAEDGTVSVPANCVIPTFDAALGALLARCLFTNALIIFVSTEAPGCVKAARVDEDGTVTPLLLTLSAPDGTPLYELERQARWGEPPTAP